MGIEHNIRTSTQCTSSFQNSFSLNQAKQEESNKNSFHHQTLKQHNSTNTQPFLWIQGSIESAKQGLPKAYHSFVNSGSRKLTKPARQLRFKGCLAVLK